MQRNVESKGEFDQTELRSIKDDLDYALIEITKSSIDPVLQKDLDQHGDFIKIIKELLAVMDKHQVAPEQTDKFNCFLLDLYKTLNFHLRHPTLEHYTKFHELELKAKTIFPKDNESIITLLHQAEKALIAYALRFYYQPRIDLYIEFNIKPTPSNKNNTVQQNLDNLLNKYPAHIRLNIKNIIDQSHNPILISVFSNILLNGLKNNVDEGLFTQVDEIINVDLIKLSDDLYQDFTSFILHKQIISRINEIKIQTNLELLHELQRQFSHQEEYCILVAFITAHLQKLEPKQQNNVEIKITDDEIKVENPQSNRANKELTPYQTAFEDLNNMIDKEMEPIKISANNVIKEIIFLKDHHADETLLTEALIAVKKVIEVPNSIPNQQACNRSADQLGSAPLKRTIAGLIQCTLGVSLIITSTTSFIFSFGISAPFSALGICAGAMLITSGLATAGFASSQLHSKGYSFFTDAPIKKHMNYIKQIALSKSIYKS